MIPTCEVTHDSYLIKQSSFMNMKKTVSQYFTVAGGDG